MGRVMRLLYPSQLSVVNAVRISWEIQSAAYVVITDSQNDSFFPKTKKFSKRFFTNYSIMRR